MNTQLETFTANALREAHCVSDAHPVWSGRPWKVFLRTSTDVLARIGYVERNPMKERLTRQTFPFVVPYCRK